MKKRVGRKGEGEIDGERLTERRSKGGGEGREGKRDRQAER